MLYFVISKSSKAGVEEAEGKLAQGDEADEDGEDVGEGAGENLGKSGDVDEFEGNKLGAVDPSGGCGFDVD